MSFIGLQAVRASWTERSREEAHSVVVTGCIKFDYSKRLITGVIHCFSSVLVRYTGVRPESCVLSKWVKGPPLKPGRERVTESCVRVGNGRCEA
ncbi:hypothetical protein, partial [Thiolapillus sp.]|uniref:hypothetical protein n=1 Tax=Thiolapillus sp. TaxID=2017437 RepID=UPI0025CC47A4